MRRKSSFSLVLVLCLALVPLLSVGPQLAAAQQNDANSGGDAGDGFSTATQITPSSYTGELDPDNYDMFDYYKFNVNSGQVIGITTDVATSLYNPSGEYIDGDLESITWTADSSGYWALMLASGSPVTYSFTVSVTSQNDGGTGGDAGNTFETATSISPGSYTGHVDLGDTHDYYKFYVSAGQIIEANYDGSSFVFHPNYSGSLGYSTPYTADVSGYWVLGIYAGGVGVGDYSFTVSLTTLPSTTLTISPASFSLQSGQSTTLTATLKDDSNNPLTGKTITWTKTAGSLSATSGTTESSGQASVAYTAPSVSTSTSVTVTASFAGDSQYASSSNSSSGTISPVAVNNAPTLASGSVSPSSGTTDNTFTYETTYTDADGDDPSYVKAYIDDTSYSMSKVSGTYTGGANYQYTTTLSVGSHNYYFSTSDGTDTARLPASGTYSGPTVTEAENVPDENENVPGDENVPSGDENVPSGDENVTPSAPFEVTLTFRKPDGSLLANTTIYYGTSGGQETNVLGTTDSSGRITSSNSALASKTVYFKSSDGTYAGNTNISSSGGTVDASLTETTAGTPAFLWLVILALVTVCGVAGGVALAWKKGLLVTRPKPAKIENKVFDYFQKHGGDISKEKCLADLGITAKQFSAAVQSLVKSGRLRIKRGKHLV